jgi:hypothetical protein
MKAQKTAQALVAANQGYQLDPRGKAHIVPAEIISV